MGIPARLFLSEKEWNELKRACKERAGWRCEYIYPNKRRCAHHEGMEVWKGEYIQVNGKRQKKTTIMHMHACHIDDDPDNPTPRLICLCPMHHTKSDREMEAEERHSWYRRGYQITTTDKLIEEMQAHGLRIEEQEDGYHWWLDEFGIGGTRPTVIKAVGAALQEVHSMLESVASHPSNRKESRS